MSNVSFPLPLPRTLRDAVPPGSGVLLGVSGGVDSSVALATLLALDCRVATVTLKNFCTADGAFGGEGNASCCSLDAIDLARRQAADAGVRHWVADVEERFRDRVIDPFVDEYRGGRTPNPCVGCNTEVRFPELVRRADQLGLEFVATGHYARVVPASDGGARLLRGVDREKDQAYFLHGLAPEHLARCVFPLGWWTKAQVREVASDLGLAAAKRPESQEICFVPDDDRAFLFEPDDARPGDVVLRDGTVVGRHRGLFRYTVGQRRGLGVAAEAPLYVLELDPVRNAVVVGRREELGAAVIVCDGFRWRRGVVAEPTGLRAQFRHRNPGHGVRRLEASGERVTVELEAQAEGVAPGQFLVLERDEEILGGGRIVAVRGGEIDGRER